MISAERGLIRAFYPEHIPCLEAADPFQDPEYGLVCKGCGAILGFPGQPEPVATPEEARAAEALSGSREEPAPDPDDWVAEANEQQMIAEQDDPPFEPSDSPVAYEPVINDMPPEGETNLPAPHGSVEKSAVIPQDPIMAALDVIDPTRPYTPAEVEAQLVDLEARLERGQHFQRVWEERAYRTKLAYTLAYDAALVRIYDETKAPMDVRQAQAREENRTKYEDMSLAEMMVKAVRESMHNLRSQLSGYQSIARSVGATISGPHGYRT